jgi:hypothetical protein
MDRACASGAQGRGFEPLRARHLSSQLASMIGNSASSHSEAIKKDYIPKIILTLLVLFVLAYGYYYLTAALTSGDDVLECKAIAGLVASAAVVPESVSTPGRPAIFCDAEARGFFLTRFDHVRIYGVTDKNQQDSILEALGHKQTQSKLRKITVDFYEKENWKTWSDPGTGRRGGERGLEAPIRQVFIK